MIRKTLLILSTTLFATAAFGHGWDWELGVVEENSHWVTQNLQWAHDVHPANPSAQYLRNNIMPPPREMWCFDDEWEENCEDWSLHMDEWLHEYLDIPTSQALPSTLPDYPEECASSCDDIW